MERRPLRPESFCVAYGTTEVVSFHESGFTAVSPPILFRKEREKRMGHPLGWYDGQDVPRKLGAPGWLEQNARSLGSARDDRFGVGQRLRPECT